MIIEESCNCKTEKVKADNASSRWLAIWIHSYPSLDPSSSDDMMKRGGGIGRREEIEHVGWEQSSRASPDGR